MGAAADFPAMACICPYVCSSYRDVITKGSLSYPGVTRARSTAEPETPIGLVSLVHSHEVRNLAHRINPPFSFAYDPKPCLTNHIHPSKISSSPPSKVAYGSNSLLTSKRALVISQSQSSENHSHAKKGPREFRVRLKSSATVHETHAAPSLLGTHPSITRHDSLRSKIRAV